MKLTKQLLTGAAVAALTAGAANAQLFIHQDQATSITDLSGSPYASGNVVFASELGSLAGITVPLEFEVGRFSNTPWASASNVEGLLEVTFDGGVLDRTLTDDDISSAGAACNTAPNDLVVDSGGAAGDDSVVFRIGDLAACDDIDTGAGFGDNNPQFAFPVVLDGSAVNISFELRRASNNDLIATGSWNASSDNGITGLPLILQNPAVEHTASVGTATATTASLFTTFVASGGATATLGTVTPAIGALGPYTPRLADGTLVAGADIDELNYFCTFDSIVGLDATTGALGGFGNDANLSSDNPVPFTGTSANLGVNTLSISANALASVQIGEANCAGEVVYTTASGLSDTALPSALVGYIRREGVTSEKFEWTGDSNAVTRSIFRLTGIPASPVPSASVIVSDSSNGMDGEYAISLGTPSNGEVILTNADLAAAAGDFGRANVQIAVHQTGAPATNIVIRRLLVGQNGTLSDIGNENEDDANNRGGARITPNGSIGGGDDT